MQSTSSTYYSNRIYSESDGKFSLNPEDVVMDGQEP